MASFNYYNVIQSNFILILTQYILKVIPSLITPNRQSPDFNKAYGIKNVLTNDQV